MSFNLLIILGPTACGKTRLATHLAYQLQGEIISADSRQVYRRMNIGTGKDLEEYRINNKNIPYHLIDIAEPGEEYNVFRFQKDFFKTWNEILERKKIPVLCGGTGLYIDSVIKDYVLQEVPENPELRLELQKYNMEELSKRLARYKKLHNTTDSLSRERLIRAIEIAAYPSKPKTTFSVNPVIFGVQLERTEIKERIKTRLKQRFESGMIEEVEQLLQRGLSAEQLIFYGLEYKFITQYITGQLSYNDMFQKLTAAIGAFAKRQMTWYRKMERNGTKINWINGEKTTEEMLAEIKSTLDFFQ